jgi:hypothetical protein
MDYSALCASPLALLGATLRVFVAVSRRRHRGPDYDRAWAYLVGQIHLSQKRPVPRIVVEIVERLRVLHTMHK